MIAEGSSSNLLEITYNIFKHGLDYKINGLPFEFQMHSPSNCQMNIK